MTLAIELRFLQPQMQPSYVSAFLGILRLSYDQRSGGKKDA